MGLEWLVGDHGEFQDCRLWAVLFLLLKLDVLSSPALLLHKQSPADANGCGS